MSKYAKSFIKKKKVSHITDNSNLSYSSDRQVQNCVLKITGQPRYVRWG